MRKVFIVFAFVLLVGIPAVAQEHDKAEVYLGYSYARIDSGFPNHFNMNGWNGAIQGNVRPWLGLVGDFSGHYAFRRDPITNARMNINTHQALFGPRVMVPMGRLRPFAHVLFGVAKGNAKLFGSTSSETAFGMAAGGGVDVHLSDHTSWRVVQADYLMTRWFDVNRNQFRIGTGVVFRW